MKNIIGVSVEQLMGLRARVSFVCERGTESAVVITLDEMATSLGIHNTRISGGYPPSLRERYIELLEKGDSAGAGGSMKESNGHWIGPDSNHPEETWVEK